MTAAPPAPEAVAAPPPPGAPAAPPASAAVTASPAAPAVVGVPGFWLQAIKNHPVCVCVFCFGVIVMCVCV